jgi:hypothetical protein
MREIKSVVNTVLSESFTLEPPAKVMEYLKSSDSSADVAEILNEKAWEQVVATLAFGGLPGTPEECFNKLESLEVDVRNYFALKSDRPGGARSKGTGFKLHPTFKSYKSTIKGAIEQGVELLNAAGVPRSRTDVTNDIKDAKHVEKAPSEKLTGATATWLALYDQCDPNDPAVIALVNQIADKVGLPHVEEMAEAA